MLVDGVSEAMARRIHGFFRKSEVGNSNPISTTQVYQMQLSAMPVGSKSVATSNGIIPAMGISAFFLGQPDVIQRTLHSFDIRPRKGCV